MTCTHDWRPAYLVRKGTPPRRYGAHCARCGKWRKRRQAARPYAERVRKVTP